MNMKPIVWFSRNPQKSDLEFLELHGIDFSVISEFFGTIWLSNLLKIFLRPLKTNNFKYGRLRDICSENSKIVRILHSISNYLPKYLSVKSYISILTFIDSIIRGSKLLHPPKLIITVAFFTSNLQFLELARRNGALIYSIVYSWDNPFKYNLLPANYHCYLVWNGKMADDLKRLHHVSKSKTRMLGALQFDYLLQDYAQISKSHDTLTFIEKVKDNYFLFLFSSSYNAYKQEIGLLLYLSRLLYEMQINTVIVARPYPNIKDKSVYKEIEHLENVFFDSSVFDTSDDFHLMIKQKLIKECKAVINIVTTMALEAAVLNKPIIQLAFLPDSIEFSNSSERYLDLDYIMRNDHLNDYLFKREFKSVVTCESDLKQVIGLLQNDHKEELLVYSKYLAGFSVQSLNIKSSDLYQQLFSNI
ncbi:MAG: hypothetical protein FMNOHCHN_00342 [Ignavibacteriaceae bacterium]|nr:hypothetical protein [Ignavibacteriaceae bacterium]